MLFSKHRYLGKMKSFFKNRAASKGCTAECYIEDEVVTFLERYFGQDKWNERLPRVDDNSTYVLPAFTHCFPRSEN